MFENISLNEFYYGEGFTSLLIAVLTIYLFLECLRPLYPVKSPVIRRWMINVGLYVFNILVLYSSLHVLTESSLGLKYGLFNLVKAPVFIQFITFLIVFDLLQYSVHVLSHKYIFLWRIHVTHHADPDIDSTTSLRHHPFDFLLEYLMKLSVLILLGVDFSVLIIYDILLTCHTFFAHSNLKVPHKLDRIMRYLIITPDMHRVHHSILPKEANNNYGFILSIWDRLFKTHLNIPVDDQKKMRIGLSYFREEDLGFFATPLQPFRYKKNVNQISPLNKKA